MAIQMRRGMKKDFDPSKLLPGEWAIAIDEESKNQIIWMCFAAGIVKRMGTFEDFRQQIAEATDEIKSVYIEEFSALLEQIEQVANEATKNKDMIITIRDNIVKTYIPQILGYVDSASNSAAMAADSEQAAAQSASAALNSASSVEESEINAKESERASKISEDAARQYSEVAGECASASEGFANIAEEKSRSANESAVESAESASISTAKAAEAAESESRANSAAIDSMRYANYTSSNAERAEEKAAESENYALQAQSYALGQGNIRPDESQDSAKYYYEQAKKISESFAGALRPMGTVNFADLPELPSAVEGDMYNISNEFVTNSDFKEGSGHAIPAGANVYKTADNKWDILAGTPVTGVKGNSESNYRKGNVNITPENIGAPSSEYIEEHFTPDYATSSNGAPSKKGWYRIAMAKQFGCHSCVISLKRRYNSPSPEYQKVQLIDVYTAKKFVSLAACSGTHFWSKIRYVLDENNSTSYIEIYQDRDTAENTWIITIEDAVGYSGFYMKAIAPVATEETVAGVKVLASLDLPANFDSDYLAKKDGSNVNGSWSNLIAGKALRDGDGNVIKDSYAVKKLLNGGDFNDMTTPGIYTMKACSQNAPSSSSYYGLLVLQSDSGNYIEQIAYQESSFRVFVRYLSSNSWSRWEQLIVESDLVNKIYPVGSIYMSVNSTSPATLFGGTWVSWGNGRVPVGVDTSQTEFNTAERTGGSKYLQSHVHTTEDSNYGFTTYKSGGSIARLNVQVVSPGTKMSFTADAGTKDIDYSKKTASAGSGNSENLQPYITCYMWKRTA